jgi:hypothetical protein
MCWKWRKSKQENNNPPKLTTPESNNSENTDYEKTKTLLNSYYSPYCTKRPFHASKICQNCKRIFYCYVDNPYCSKECKFTKLFSGYNSN